MHHSSFRRFREHFCQPRAALLAGLLLLLSPRPVRAENALAYKYEDYREADGRIAVTTQSALLDQELPAGMRLKLQGVIDSIAGATPNGQPAPAGSDQVVLTTIHDRRREWDADLSRRWGDVELAAGVNHSKESDYLSKGWSLNLTRDLNQKNTTLQAGIAGSDDDVKVFYQTPWARKHAFQAMTGFTQVLDANTAVTADLTWERDTGYLNDQYKLVQKLVAVAPGVYLPFTYGENRPGTRTKAVALVALNHSCPGLNGALDASYRFYHDSYGTGAHTLTLAWLQHVRSRLVLVPSLRLYRQGAADFYHYRLDGTDIVPVAGAPRPAGPFYSSDYRLSELGTSTVGLKAVLTLTPHCELDAGGERYAMHGRDGVTPASAYPRASILRLGGQYTW